MADLIVKCLERKCLFRMKDDDFRLSMFKDKYKVIEAVLPLKMKGTRYDGHKFSVFGGEDGTEYAVFSDWSAKRLEEVNHNGIRMGR